MTSIVLGSTKALDPERIVNDTLCDILREPTLREAVKSVIAVTIIRTEEETMKTIESNSHLKCWRCEAEYKLEIAR